MCHPEVPAGQATPTILREELSIPLAGGEAMPALLARPEGGEGPGILIVHDIFGRSPFYENLAARLASAGFVALLPDYFFRQGPLAERKVEVAFQRRAKLDEVGALQDLSVALDVLGQQTGLRGDCLGTVGFCMGGTLVLDLAALRDDLATVCFYGFPAPEAHGSARSAPAPLDEVDRMQGPILGFWGDQDHGVDMADVGRLASELRKRGVSFEHTIYPGLGHGFMAQSNLDVEHPAYQAACEAWTRSLGFFRRHLAVPTLA
ncbi:MAG: dienelactone hydrolase family protein [Chloroflexi bacterium]|nr:dienelactone hydrolase family protein [Chloroflexota bacterium]